MEDWGNRAASAAQRKYGVSSNPASENTPTDAYDGPENPLPSKKSTQGSISGKIAWRVPKGAAFSSQSRTSTLFDEPTQPNQIPREG